MLFMQRGPEVGSVLEVEEGSFCNLVEGGVWDDSKVADLGGGSDDEAIDVESKGLGEAAEAV